MITTCISSPGHGKPRRLFEKNGTPIYGCRTCGSFMADIAYDANQYESGEYYTVALRSARAVDEEWGFRWRYLLRKAVALLGEPGVLDVGAGNGYFVHLAKTEFGLNAQGLEVSANEIRYAKALFGVELSDLPLERLPTTYDLVTSFNVLEHVADPLALLRGMHARLRDGGMLFLTTPNPSCIHRRLRGLRRWNMIDPPHHINLFPKAACRQLVERAGFETVAYETLSTYVRFVRKLDGKQKRLRKVAFQALRLTGLGADHLFLAKKPHVARSVR